MRRWMAAVSVLVLASALAACAPKADYSARFVRYEMLEDGRRVAVVDPVTTGGRSEEQLASTDITDLKRDELVGIHYVGRSWDEPRWMPEREIVSRGLRP